MVQKQITSNADIVNLCTLDNLNTNMWKYQLLKEIERSRKEELQSILKLPGYAAFVKKHEILWNKKRSEFNHLEKEFIERKYSEIGGTKNEITICK